MVENNIRCPDCGANAWHLDRESSGKYALKCMRANGCRREIELKRDTLSDLRYYS